MLLAIDDVGPGPAVVLLHGFPFNRKMWDGQTADVGSTYRILAPDLRGHGESPVPEGVYSIDDMADDVLETLDAFQISEPVVLGGLSMGGYVALSIACRFPERIRGLMLLNTRAAADSPQVAENREVSARTIERSGQVDSVVEGMLPRLFSPITRERRPDLIVRLRDQMLGSPPQGVINTLRGMAIRPDRTAELRMINVPTLVLAGQDDQIIPLSESEELARSIPRARLAVIPNAGHLAPLENAADSNRVILDYLGSLR